MFILSSVLTHALGQAVLPTSAANTNGGVNGVQSESASSSQPLWSYQVKPSTYVNSPSAQTGHYSSAMPSLFDAFNGLSQRQGALTSSPFLSILPIILIAAGGMLLLLPLLTMMMASPFGGGFGGGYNGGFGYPQVGALNRKRSLNEQGGARLAGGNGGSLIDLIEHVSSTIDELTKKYSPATTAITSGQQQQQHQKRAKSLTGELLLQQAAAAAPQPANHKPTEEDTANLVN